MISDIHNKISRSGSNITETREDKLTGDIFGVMRYLPANKLMLPFLNSAYFIDPINGYVRTPALTFLGEPILRFWPRYNQVEPDVEIQEQTGQLRIFVEIKYKSGLSGDDQSDIGENPQHSRHQLIKQMFTLARLPSSGKRILIFLTEDGSYPDSVMDYVLKEKKKHSSLSNTEIYWLSWNILAEVADHINPHRTYFEDVIISDVIKFCEKKGFKRFRAHRASLRRSFWSFCYFACNGGQLRKHARWTFFYFGHTECGKINNPFRMGCCSCRQSFPDPTWSFANE